jgi:NAD-specific glutamate dehydrogenase
MMSGPPTSSRPMPFGVFFCHGRHFNAFHCRFRDIARGEKRREEKSLDSASPVVWCGVGW